MNKSFDYNERFFGFDIRFIILHYTQTETLASTFAIMAERHVSAHYIIDIDGAVYNMVDESKRAWHAGESFWQGIRDINSYSIGIELQNDGVADFPKAQLEALVQLLGDITARYDIQPCGILAHSDIAPARKQDPGEKFPWEWLSCQGFGFFPMVSASAGALAIDLPDYLDEIGYENVLESILAFQRRYRPSVIDGKADDECACLAFSILENLQ